MRTRTARCLLRYLLCGEELGRVCSFAILKPRTVSEWPRRAQMNFLATSRRSTSGWRSGAPGRFVAWLCGRPPSEMGCDLLAGWPRPRVDTLAASHCACSTSCLLLQDAVQRDALAREIMSGQQHEVCKLWIGHAPGMRRLLCRPDCRPRTGWRGSHKACSPGAASSQTQPTSRRKDRARAALQHFSHRAIGDRSHVLCAARRR